MFEIVIAAHRLVDAKGAHEGHGGRGHAVARIGVKVVRAEAAAHQLRCRIALHHRPLAGSEHADAFRALGLEHLLDPGGHGVEGLVPGYRLELAFLVEDAICLAHQGRGQAVVSVHDLGQEITFDAVQAAVDLGLHVAMGGDDLAFLDADHDAAAGAAKAAGGLGPFYLKRLDPAADGLGCGRQAEAGGTGGDGHSLRLEKIAPCQI